MKNDTKRENGQAGILLERCSKPSKLQFFELPLCDPFRASAGLDFGAACLVRNCKVILFASKVSQICVYRTGPSCLVPLPMRVTWVLLSGIFDL